jgi:TonB family protein
MFLDFYKIREQPFGETPDPRYLYLSPTHREAIASLAYGLDAGRGFLALVAEPGMGKTTLLFHLLEWVRESARTVFLFQTQCGSRALLRYLLADLGIDAQGKGLAWMHEQLKEVLVNEASVGRRLVLFIDEAQNLSESALETVRLLSDFENPRSKLIQILLAGQTELADKLAHPAMGQLRQRLSILARLSPFTRSETEAYISHRLSVAGSADRQLFTHDARAMIAEWSRGVPRNINNLCFSALSLGYAMGKDKVDCSVLQEVISDLDVTPLVTGPYDRRRPREVLAVPSAAVPPCVSELAAPEDEASGELEAPPREEFEPVMTVGASGKEASSVVTFKAHSSRPTMVSAGIALFTLFVIGAPGISFLHHALTQPAVASLASIPSQNAKQTQHPVADVRPLESRFGRPEKKPGRAADVLHDELLATRVPVPRWESLQGILAENANIPAVPPTTPEGTAPVRVGGGVKEPILTSSIAPIYPPEARQRGVAGEVVIDAVIDATGRPTNLNVVSGPALLRPAALDSVRKWQYLPGYVDDHPAAVEVIIAVEFRLVN